MAAGAGAGTGITRGRPAHMRWNFTVLGADMAFFSLGLSISSAYTVLPLFVHHLTLNNEAVALIPAIRALGQYGPQLFVSDAVERRTHALPYILRATVLERVPFLILALAALVFAQSNPAILVTLFLLMILLANTGSGLTYPAWLDLIARAIPREWFGRFVGLWTGLGGFLGIGGAAVAAAILANVSFPLNFALCFLLTFGTFIISFVLLALGREPARTVRPMATSTVTKRVPPRERLRRQARDIVALLREDRGLQRLLMANALAGIATMASALFAVAALKRGGLNDAEVGAESTLLFVAMTGGNFLWGAIGDRFGHRAVLVYGSVCAALGPLVALWAHGFWAYGAVFLLLGLNLAATSLAGLTFIAEFGPEVRRPTYVALASVAYAPFAIIPPIIGGFLADALSYPPVFVISAAAGVLATITYQVWVPDPRKRPVGVPDVAT